MNDTISRRAAIDALWEALYEYEDKTKKQFQESDELDVEDWILHREFVQNMNDIDRQTILNLPSAEPKPCEYCNEDVDGFVTPLEKNGHAFVRFGMNGWELSLKANGWHGSAKIRYCPMCGRDLFVKGGVK